MLLGKGKALWGAKGDGLIASPLVFEKALIVENEKIGSSGLDTSYSCVFQVVEGAQSKPK